MAQGPLGDNLRPLKGVVMMAFSRPSQAEAKGQWGQYTECACKNAEQQKMCSLSLFDEKTNKCCFRRKLEDSSIFLCDNFDGYLYHRLTASTELSKKNEVVHDFCFAI